jgi:hypothetical protein
MATNDFLAYFGDFAAGYVQYGSTKAFCEALEPYEDLTGNDLFLQMINLAE